MSVLDKLFGSPARIKLIRLFFLNPETAFAAKDIAVRTQMKPYLMYREMRLLQEIGFIKRGTAVVHLKPDGNGKIIKKRVDGFLLDPMFPLTKELKNLVLSGAPVIRQDLVGRLRRIGRVKLLILAGIFLKEDNSRIDMLIVGDNI